MNIIQYFVSNGIPSNGRTYYGGNHSCDRMVVGFTTTCAISAYHHY